MHASIRYNLINVVIFIILFTSFEVERAWATAIAYAKQKIDIPTVHV